jgi:hypothetical protein
MVDNQAVTFGAKEQKDMSYLTRKLFLNPGLAGSSD